jgi:hypothetical protein
MKARLTKDYFLVITPETAEEHIALQAWEEKKQGSGLLVEALADDPLYETAQALLALHDEYGSVEFVRRFGTMDIVDVCRQIVAEGEGNVHPWHRQTSRHSN